MFVKKKLYVYGLPKQQKIELRQRQKKKLPRKLRRPEVELRSQNTMFGDRKKSPRAENILRAAIKYAMKLETPKAC